MHTRARRSGAQKFPEFFVTVMSGIVRESKAVRRTFELLRVHHPHWQRAHATTANDATPETVTEGPSTSSATSTSVAKGSTDETIEQVRARIFGNHIGDGLRSGRKVLRRPLIGEQLTSYYPPNWFAGDPLLVDIEAETKKAKLQRLSRRGKAPPKKGSGKRAKT